MNIRRVRVLLAAVLAIGSTAAGAVSVDNLEGPGFEPIYGDYALGGNCSLEPRVTIAATGLIFRANGSTTHSRKIEFAASYQGRDYDGISLVFFPFPLGEYEVGRVIMTANAGEVPGQLLFEDNSGPGERLDSLEATLVRTGAFKRCAGAAARPDAAPADAASVEVPAGQPTPWEVVPVDGGLPLAYVDAAGSPNIESFSIFCSEGQPAIAMLLKNGKAADKLRLSWGFGAGMIDVILARSNGEGTFWQAYLGGSGLLEELLHQAGTASLGVDGAAEGTASLKGSTAAIKTALAACATL